MIQHSSIKRRKFVAATAATALAPAVLAKQAAAQDAVTIKYQLWDANQLPAYQACADEFVEAQPDIIVEIEQLGWDDYWTGIQTGMISGSAPDVFTNHLAKYPEFAEKNQLVDIQPMVDADSVSVDGYEGELAELWSQDGQRYGLPKDWDTVAVVYNKAMLDAARIDPAIFEEWTWNPDDGGTFGETIAKLSIDENGNDGTSPDFDATKVAQYGLALSVGDAYGQTGWSFFAASTGWRFIDAPWEPLFHFDDERVINTIQWLADQSLVNGFCVPEEQIPSLEAETLFTSGKSALVFHGLWMINWFADNAAFEFGFGRRPTGPESRICMFNGLADSIWTG